MLIVTIQVNAPPGAAECVKEVLGMALEQLGDELLKLTQEVACGKQTKAESLGYTEMAIARVCNFV